jgi:hypothetical protein
MSKDVLRRLDVVFGWYLEGGIRSRYDDPSTDSALLSPEVWARHQVERDTVRDAQDDKIKASLDKFLGTGNEHYFVDALALPYRLAP